MGQIIKLKDCPQTLSGVYKLNFPNGKSYIGISIHIRKRLNEHNRDAKVSHLPVHLALNKYGPISEFELLEEIPSNDRQQLCEREIYWINFYDTTNKEKGYNISPGGDGSAAGWQNPSCDLTESDINEIYDLLINSQEFMYNIAERFHTSQEAISNINRGIHHIKEGYTYPLRESTRFQKGHTLTKKGIEHHNALFDKEDIEEIYDLLKNHLEYSINQIGEMKGISYSSIFKINRGITYHDDAQEYPLRKAHAKNTSKISQEQLNQIRSDLINHTYPSLSALARATGFSASVISRINSGQTYYDDSLNYPLNK